MISCTTLKFGALLSVMVAVFVYYPRRDELRARVDEIYQGLLSIEKTAVVNYESKVALGFGACKDLIVQALELFDTSENPPEPVHYDTINTRQQLLEVFIYFFSHGAAGERFVTNGTLFQELVQGATSLSNSRVSLGGNAPLMGARVAKEGYNVLLGSKMSEELKKMLPASVKIVGGTSELDDVHLILEYPAGATWGPYTAPRANRFIIHNDHNNPTISSLEEFQNELLVYQPGLLVITGLHMMDHYPFKPGQREDRIRKVQNLVSSQPFSTKIHFEMASYSDAELLKYLVKHVIPYADSLGMNEQELPNLVSMLTTGEISFVSDSHPRVASVLDQMRQLYRLMDAVQIEKKRDLTRLHVHTLAYQAIMVKKISTWRNRFSAAAKAALTANRYVCGTSEVDTSTAKIIMDESFSVSLEIGSRRIVLDNANPVSCWDEKDMEICVAPVLVCTNVHQTAGGGDNISSAGLVIQV